MRSGGGQRAAAMYNLYVTAKMNGVDPQAWIADILARIAAHLRIGLTSNCLGTGGRKVLLSPLARSLRIEQWPLARLQPCPNARPAVHAGWLHLGRASTIIAERQRIKRGMIKTRRLQHHLQAA